LEPDKAISELNNIFHEHSLKYRYENGRIVRLRRIKRLKNICYYLYSPGEYGFVEYDLMEAYNRLMLNDFTCVVRECHAAFRSVLLRIHERKGIVYHEQDSLNTLMANLMARGVISAEYVHKFHFLSNVLESEIFLPMAPEKSHHHYAMMLRISEELACSIYYLTERSIFFLTQRAEEDSVAP
ncbi:cytoplasmic protein, partial [Salmonella enterica subsp. enterica serovar Cerro]